MTIPRVVRTERILLAADWRSRRVFESASRSSVTIFMARPITLRTDFITVLQWLRVEGGGAPHRSLGEPLVAGD